MSENNLPQDRKNVKEFLGIPRRFYYQAAGIAAGILLVFPFLVTLRGPECLSYRDTGEIGDTIGGIAGPIIAAFVGVLTFMAFYAQWQSNQDQTKQFAKQDHDSKVDRFEQRFFEMLRVHRDNVNEIDLGIHKGVRVEKRNSFVNMFNEFKFCYWYLILVQKMELEKGTIDKPIPEHEIVNFAYLVFYFGLDFFKSKPLTAMYGNFSPSLLTIGRTFLSGLESFLDMGFREVPTFQDQPNFKLEIDYPPLRGHDQTLGHYFRHLFHSVSYVHNTAPPLKIDGYQYMLTIRAQLSSYEQLLLYYNSCSTLGNEWINRNYFVTYRLIKNIPLPLADFGVKPKEKLGEKDNQGRPLFEWDEIGF